MTYLYLDTKFDGFKGKLISMALVSCKNNENGVSITDSQCTDSQWYEVLEDGMRVQDQWVISNILPFLGKIPISFPKFKESLLSFLKFHVINTKNLTIVAAWPEDIIHLLSFLYEQDGRQIHLNIDFKLIMSGKLDSKVPHNALMDAIALMEWHQEKLRLDRRDEILSTTTIPAKTQL